MYILADIKRNCRNQDLYRNEDDFWQNLKKKKNVIFYEKDFIFSAKCIILADIKWNCKNSRFIYKQRRLLKKIYSKKIRVFLFKIFYIL